LEALKDRFGTPETTSSENRTLDFPPQVKLLSFDVFRRNPTGSPQAHPNSLPPDFEQEHASGGPFIGNSFRRANLQQYRFPWRERQDRLESRLLAGLQNAVLQPEEIDYAVSKFEEELTKQLRGPSGEVDKLRQR
jgi:hypothetical protein